LTVVRQIAEDTMFARKLAGAAMVCRAVFALWYFCLGLEVCFHIGAYFVKFCVIYFYKKIISDGYGQI
jgi:hypothetical protein